MKRIILLLSICFLFFAFYSTSMYDENYQVVKTIETVEIRQYPVAIYASYTKEKTIQIHNLEFLQHIFLAPINKTKKLG